MIYEHETFHDGSPFFDEIGWVGFIQRSQNWVCTPWFIHTVIKPATGNSPNLVASKYRNYAGKTPDTDLDGRAMTVDLSTSAGLDYYETHFIAYPYYITSDESSWRLVVVPQEAERFNSYFIWGGTREAWAQFRPFMEALPSTIPIESEELANRDPRQWVFTRRSDPFPKVVLDGAGPLQFVGDLGLAWD
jgi:hypothetical protein